MNSETNTQQNPMSQEDLGRKIYENSQKSLMLQRISAICVAGLFAVVLIAAIMVIPRTLRLIDEVHTAAQSVTDTVSKAEVAINDLSEMANSLEDTSENFDKLIAENSGALTDSLDKIANIDFEGLNKGIQDLQNAVGPFANLMSRFGR
jgi:predicted PurR-regulated permease PerM